MKGKTMFKTLISGIALSVALAGAAVGEDFEVKMLNRGEAGTMVFEPSFLQIAVGDTVKFIAEDRGHNAESIPEMMPEGGTAFEGKINEEVDVTFETEGLYGVRCKPHYAMGMVMTIAVGEAVEAPEGYLEGRIPKGAMKRFEEQIANL